MIKIYEENPNSNDIKKSGFCTQERRTYNLSE
jgi:hypothetical protein